MYDNKSVSCAVYMQCPIVRKSLMLGNIFITCPSNWGSVSG